MRGYSIKGWLVAGVAMAALVACSSKPEIRAARIRLLPGDLPLAGYVTLDNRTDRPLVLTGAASPAFGRVMLHRSVNEQGQSKMVHVARVSVEPGAALSLSPGGYHLMLMQRTGELAVGDTVPITLRFADSDARTIEFTVQGATTQ